MAMALKNFTFSLPQELVEKLKRHVDDLQLPSMNHVVRETLESRVKELDKQKLRLTMQAAARDPLFLNDIEECMTAFKHADKLEEI